jgi:hypothetical protein
VDAALGDRDPVRGAVELAVAATVEAGVAGHGRPFPGPARGILRDQALGMRFEAAPRRGS